MEASSGVALAELRADGGATANAWMLQFQADLLGVPVVVPEISETTALGAAYLAGVATGTWSEQDVRTMWREAARYEPNMGDDQREGLLAGWKRAVETTRNHSERPG
jgi:glycerol kinase